MYLLNLGRLNDNLQHDYHLHSTMYLLNQCDNIHSRHEPLHLHSTMYLLNPYLKIPSETYYLFTFHYVSIKSSCGYNKENAYIDLHSTMYLLNRQSVACTLYLWTYLHSTMYLLNRTYVPSTVIRR